MFVKYLNNFKIILKNLNTNWMIEWLQIVNGVSYILRLPSQSIKNPLLIVCSLLLLPLIMKMVCIWNQYFNNEKSKQKNSLCSYKLVLNPSNFKVVSVNIKPWIFTYLHVG
jgi:hypothetical protein